MISTRKDEHGREIRTLAEKSGICQYPGSGGGEGHQNLDGVHEHHIQRLLTDLWDIFTPDGQLALQRNLTGGGKKIDDYLQLMADPDMEDGIPMEVIICLMGKMRGQDYPEREIKLWPILDTADPMDRASWSRIGDCVTQLGIRHGRGVVDSPAIRAMARPWDGMVPDRSQPAEGATVHDGWQGIAPGSYKANELKIGTGWMAVLEGGPNEFDWNLDNRMPYRMSPEASAVGDYVQMTALHAVAPGTGYLVSSHLGRSSEDGWIRTVERKIAQLETERTLDGWIKPGEDAQGEIWWPRTFLNLHVYPRLVDEGPGLSPEEFKLLDLGEQMEALCLKHGFEGWYITEGPGYGTRIYEDNDPRKEALPASYRQMMAPHQQGMDQITEIDGQEYSLANLEESAGHLNTRFISMLAGFSTFYGITRWHSQDAKDQGHHEISGENRGHGQDWRDVLGGSWDPKVNRLIFMRHLTAFGEYFWGKPYQAPPAVPGRAAGSPEIWLADLYKDPLLMDFGECELTVCWTGGPVVPLEGEYLKEANGSIRILRAYSEPTPDPVDALDHVTRALEDMQKAFKVLARSAGDLATDLRELLDTERSGPGDTGMIPPRG